MKTKYALLVIASAFASLTSFAGRIGGPPNPVPETGTTAAVAFLAAAAAVAIGRRMMQRK
jgi:hypothetical protein